MQRVSRYPPLNARLVVLEEGPPMYRMLGYADKNNLQPDLCHPALTSGFFGPFSQPCLPSTQVMPFGPARYGLPQRALPYSTLYWDDCASPRHAYLARRPTNKMSVSTPAQLPEERAEARLIPERAVPGTGLHSRCTDSGFLHVPDLRTQGTGKLRFVWT